MSLGCTAKSTSIDRGGLFCDILAFQPCRIRVEVSLRRLAYRAKVKAAWLFLMLIGPPREEERVELLIERIKPS